MVEHSSGGLITHRLNLRLLGAVDVYVPSWGGTNDFGIRELEDSRTEAVAVCYGAWRTSDRPPLVRVQSRCMYGEVLFSTDCDCRDQLDLAMKRMRDEEAGIVIYLDQEGRDAGQLAKARGYSYSQAHQVDSFEAYSMLEYDPDGREYTEAAELLTSLGVQKIRLLTNNPRKIEGLQKFLDSVEREELWLIHPSAEVSSYLRSKMRRGHLMPEPATTDATLTAVPWHLESTPNEGIKQVQAPQRT